VTETMEVQAAPKEAAPGLDYGKLMCAFFPQKTLERQERVAEIKSIAPCKKQVFYLEKALLVN